MAMSSKKSLADKISGLLNAAPSYNPDESATECTAKIVEYEDHEESTHVPNMQILSTFRKNNMSLLDEVDGKYAGIKGLRKDVSFQSCDENDLEPEFCDQEESDSEEGSEEEEGSNADERQENEESFKHLNEANLQVITNKAQCVQNQIRIWESLLEMRIQLQKCLVVSNKLPMQDIYGKMKESSDFLEKSESLKMVLSETVGNMLELQELLIERFPESKNALNDAGRDQEDEILSDSETEMNVENADQPMAKKKKLSTSELETRASNLHKSYKIFRNSTIQMWNDKTQVARGKTADTNSVLNQIDFNLSDKPKLIKRTHLKRSDYRILGDEAISESNTNIFDDDDFYHQLLRELIEVKSAGITDPIELSRQWIRLQNMRGKMKRKIDTKATKGRKIRYGIHTKLVNFMAPINHESTTDEAQTELFSSLFGKKSKCY